MIRLTNVTKRYHNGDTECFAVRNISLVIERGEFVSILGSSGSGKSTLMHLIGGLDRPTEGSVEIHNKNLAKMSDRALAAYRNHIIGFVFQSFNLLSHVSALENVMLPLVYSHRRVNRRARAKKLLTTLGLEKKLSNKPAELSGGEQQRVAIARAIVNVPDIILADEPTGNLDSKTGEYIIEMLSVLHRAGKTVVVVTHDQHLAQRAGRIIHIHDGQIL